MGEVCDIRTLNQEWRYICKLLLHLLSKNFVVIFILKELFETLLRKRKQFDSQKMRKRFLSSIFFWLSNKYSFAAFRAEIVVFTLVLTYCGKFLIHFYSAYRIDRQTIIGT